MTGGKVTAPKAFMQSWTMKKTGKPKTASCSKGPTGSRSCYKTIGALKLRLSAITRQKRCPLKSHLSSFRYESPFHPPIGAPAKTFFSCSMKAAGLCCHTFPQLTGWNACVFPYDVRGGLCFSAPADSVNSSDKSWAAMLIVRIKSGISSQVVSSTKQRN